MKVEPSPKGEVVLKVYPLWIWLPALFTIVLLSISPLVFWQRALFQLLGVALLAWPSILTVAVDRGSKTLNLHFRSLFRNSTQVYRFDEIASIKVAADWENERLYRVELVLRSGQAVALQYGYSVGKTRKERRAQRLRDALGIAG
jgi:hypothetical protein